jgi:hypothetical protein
MVGTFGTPPFWRRDIQVRHSMNSARLSSIVTAVVLGVAVTAFAQDKPKELPKEAPAVNVTGMWDLAVETPQGTMSLSAAFKQDGEKLTGTQSSQMGEVALEGSVKGTDIAFVVVINMQGQDLTITYTGKIDGDTMSGAVDFGGFGSSTWSAQKKK